MAIRLVPSWLQPTATAPAGAPEHGGPDEFERLWRGFMTARLTLGLVLLVLQSTLYVLAQSQKWLVLLCGAYVVVTLATRTLGTPRRLGRTFGPLWLSTVGLDLAVFGLLQFVQGHSGINYTPLLALPVLLASVLGSLALAMGTAAGATLLLLSQATSMAALDSAGDAASSIAQAALTGAGCFAIAFLASQLSGRLATEEQRSRRSRIAVDVQRQVNALVIESLHEGILVIDLAGTVWAANPAACRMLGRDPLGLQTPFELANDPVWRDLGQLMTASFATDRAQRVDLVFNHAGSGPRHVQVRTRMTATGEGGSERLCVMFLQDRREVEARMRTEKLASMGRMSTAVAHEIRNPLAAIVQANALLDEEVVEPRLRQLIGLVRQNALRLEHIVDDVLNVSRVPDQRQAAEQPSVALGEATVRIGSDWCRHTQSEAALWIDPVRADLRVVFDEEHLRRVLINLLDNARRHASGAARSIQMWSRVGPQGNALLGIWSDGAPMDDSVQRHLFEPFFSSESRSTGLGLYICRELCERYGASIGFARRTRPVAGKPVEGNEFRVAFEAVVSARAADTASARMAFTPWLQDRP